MKEEFNIDKFGEIMDGFLKDNPVQLVITLPEGTLEPDIKSNTKMGPVIDMYIMTHALRKTLTEIFKMEIMDKNKKSDFLDEILKVIKNEVMEGENE